MASPQLENGYTKISNELMEALARIRINGEARQVLDVIFRKTYGFNKKKDKIALSQFSLATGLKRPTICKAINKLKTMNLIIITQKDNSDANIFIFNKDFDTWEALPKKVTLPKKVMTITQKGNKTITQKGTYKRNILMNTKETLTKESTPAEKMKEFIKNPEGAIKVLVEKGINEELVKSEIKKFISYWTELNKSGTKQRWEKQETFEVGHRLATWFNNIKSFNKTNNSKIVTI